MQNAIESKTNRYEFVLADGSHIAVEATSKVEAAKIVREMLNS